MNKTKLSQRGKEMHGAYLRGRAIQKEDFNEIKGS